jgi:hypothetical protein
MPKEGGQMQLIPTCGHMPSEQQMIAGIMHQPMNMTPAQCQDSLQPAAYQQSIIITNFNALILKTINPDSIYPIKDIYK